MQQHARRRLGPRALSPSTYDGLCTLSLPGFIRDGHRIPRNPSSAEEGKGAQAAQPWRRTGTRRTRPRREAAASPPWTPPRVAQSPPHPRKLRNVSFPLSGFLLGGFSGLFVFWWKSHLFHVCFSLLRSHGYIRGEAAIVDIDGARFHQQVRTWSASIAVFFFNFFRVSLCQSNFSVYCGNPLRNNLI